MHLGRASVGMDVTHRGNEYLCGAVVICVRVYFACVVDFGEYSL